jgi:hypothetical protein
MISIVDLVLAGYITNQYAQPIAANEDSGRQRQVQMAESLNSKFTEAVGTAAQVKIHVEFDGLYMRHNPNCDEPQLYCGSSDNLPKLEDLLHMANAFSPSWKTADSKIPNYVDLDELAEEALRIEVVYMIDKDTYRFEISKNDLMTLRDSVLAKGF